MSKDEATLSPDDTPEMVEVIQSDRGAAAALVRWQFPNTPGAGDGIIEGQWDHEQVVQAFARHRLASTKALRKAVRQAISDLNTPGHLGGAPTNRIAANLRAALASGDNQ